MYNDIHVKGRDQINIAQTTLSAWNSGRKTRTNSKGWITGNAVCCQHNGESVDTRGRGGLIVSGNSVSYHCFNCAWRASYTEGYPLSHKFRKLLRWLDLSENEIYKLSIEAMREAQRQERLGLVKLEHKEEIKVKFKKHPIPASALPLKEWLAYYELSDSTDYAQGFVDSVSYLADRRVDLTKYEFFWDNTTKGKQDRRVIIPFTWKDKIIGYCSRAIDSGVLPKYINQFDSGYVFNLDKQGKDWKFVIVCEGVFDAISIDGVAVLKSDISQQQISLIESLNREIVVVPDWNKSGGTLIDIAVENGWAVSFPVWAETCVDINEAVVKYGKFFVMKTIVDSIERYSLKIDIMRRKYGRS